jgi:hypothetical protein
LSSGYPEEKPIGIASPYFLGIEYGEPVLACLEKPALKQQHPEPFVHRTKPENRG